MPEAGTRKNGTSLKITAILLSVTVSCVAAELIFRGYLGYTGDYLVPVGKPDLVYHHDLKPNFRGLQRYGGTETLYVTNSMGFRDKETRAVPEQHLSLRLIFLGDSFTEGIGVPYEQTFVGRIQDALPDHDVLNAAAVSYAPVLENLKLKTKILPLRPDHVVMLVDPSDVQDSIVYHDWLLRGENSPPIASADSVRRFVKRMIGKSQIIRTVLGKIAPESLTWNRPMHPDGTVWTEYSAERPRWLYDIAVWEKWGKHGMDLLLGDLRETIRICRERSIRLTLVIYPWPEHIRNRQYLFDYQGAIKSLCRENNVQLVDLFDAFDESMLSSHFIGGDVHWTAEGHALVASKILQALRSNHDTLERGSRARPAE